MTEQRSYEHDRPSLFHYTDAAGLLGILQDSLLRATDLRFLNDAQEAVYALDLFTSSLAKMENPALQQDHPAHGYAESFGENFGSYRDLVAAELGSPDMSIYVACFCEFGDLLSQWRAYGSDHGYAVEFKTDALEAAVARIPGYPRARMLMPVHYGPEAASRVLSTALRDVSQDTNLGHYGVHAHYMALRLNTLLGVIKHPGFGEEKERRVIAGFEQYDTSLMQFRSSSMAIVPYIDIAFPQDAVVSIRVGPGRHVGIRRQGVQRLLRGRGYDAQILCSSVPLRALFRTPR